MALIKDTSLDLIQAMPLVKGKIELSSGTYTGVRLVSCGSDGDITITWEDGTTTPKSLVAGDSRSVRCKSVTIDSGTFDLA